MIPGGASRWMAGLLGVLVALAVPSTALADAAGPTDYRSEVVALEPPTPSLTVSIEGGDSFVRLQAASGTDVVVLGYQGEPYLLFEADGTVHANRKSPATYYNEERFGADIPAYASATADPEWETVASDGIYAWHDHRAHRMESGPPLNAARGDQVLDGVVPLVVDGELVDVRIVSRWMPSPSPWPSILGAVSGLVIAGAAAIASMRRSSVTPAAGGIAAVGALATSVGSLQYRSLPPETGPSAVWWLLPLVATVIAVVAFAARLEPWRSALVAIASLQLVVWAVDRRSVLSRSILPTEAPFWFDRGVTAAAMTAGVVIAFAATAAAISSTSRSPRRSPR